MNAGKSGNDEREQSGGRGADLHHVQGVQHYVRQVGKVAEALSRDDDLTQKVIDAVHRGSSSSVEKLFGELGVESVVTITAVDGPSGGEPGTLARTNTGAGASKTKTITIEIGIGPFSVSVTVKKESK